jgi:hypothetical protein
LESQIVRLERVSEKKQNEYPAFAPFTAAGYFAGVFDFLQEVLLDPFLPWIFMGEEIIMSRACGRRVRYLWIESTTGHMRVTARFQIWNRAFTNGGCNRCAMVLDRVKYQLG